MGILHMKSPGKNYGLLLVTLFLFSTFASMALANQNYQDNDTSGKECCAIGTSWDVPDQIISTAENDGSNLDESDDSLPSHLPATLLSCTYTTYITNLHSSETHKAITGAYSIIFVPPRNIC
jgi:hypothetical protein